MANRSRRTERGPGSARPSPRWADPRRERTRGRSSPPQGACGAHGPSLAQPRERRNPSRKRSAGPLASQRRRRPEGGTNLRHRGDDALRRLTARDRAISTRRETGASPSAGTEEPPSSNAAAVRATGRRIVCFRKSILLPMRCSFPLLAVTGASQDPDVEATVREASELAVSSGSWRGRRTVNSAPPPGALAAVTAPP